MLMGRTSRYAINGVVSTGLRGLNASGDPPNANAGTSKLFTLSNSNGDTYLNWVENTGTPRSVVLPRYGTWTIYGNDPDAQLALDGQGQHGLIQSTVMNAGFNLPKGYGYQGTGYFSQTTGVCAGNATLQRPSCSNSFGCMTDEQFKLAQATCDDQPAMNATGCPGGWIPELRVSDCSPGQNYKQAFYNKLFSLVPPVAISNVVKATNHPYGTTSPNVVDYNTPLPTMVSLAGGGKAPFGAIVINSFPTGSQPANAFVAPPVLDSSVVTTQPKLTPESTSTPQPTMQVAPNTPAARILSGGTTSDNSVPSATQVISSASTSPSSFLQSASEIATAHENVGVTTNYTQPVPLNAPLSNSNSNASNTPNASSTDFLTQAENWASSNVLLVVVGVGALLFFGSKR